MSAEILISMNTAQLAIAIATPRQKCHLREWIGPRLLDRDTNHHRLGGKHGEEPGGSSALWFFVLVEKAGHLLTFSVKILLHL
jgi:hypothetical protein